MALNFDALKNKQARRSSNGWSPKDGDNNIRILPHSSDYFKTDVSEISYDFRTHFLKAEGANTEVVRCLRDRGEPCPFCEAYKKFREASDPNLKKNADQIRGSERHLFNIVDLSAIDAGIQGYECGNKVFDDILTFVSNPGWGDLLSPKDGRNWLINLQKTGTKSGYYEYRVSPHPNPSDISPMLPQNLYEKLDALESQIPEYPSPETAHRWLDILGFASAGAAQVTTAPQASMAQQVAQAPAQPAWTPPAAAVPATFPPTSPASVAVATPEVQTYTPSSPVGEFCAKIGIKAMMKDNELVPECYSEGPAADKANAGRTGYNEATHPCAKGCPKKAPCQLRTLGL